MNKEFFSNWSIIAGPCAAESRDQILDSAREIKIAGGNILRAGIWKPRTNPNSWQGAGNEAIDWMLEARKETGISIATEVKDFETISTVLGANFDLLWIGSRNAQNYSLLEEIGKETSDKKIPIVLKRGFSSSLDEWIGSMEYIYKNNPNVVLCERGIRGYSPDTGNILDLQTAKLAQERTCLPVLIDVSHASGRRDLILPMALASKAAGFNGLMIEVHPNPDNAKTDSRQQISTKDFSELVRRVNLIPEY